VQLSKSCVRESAPWVQIPPSPPEINPQPNFLGCGFSDSGLEVSEFGPQQVTWLLKQVRKQTSFKIRFGTFKSPLGLTSIKDNLLSLRSRG
jgi:hypothetical protein